MMDCKTLNEHMFSVD